MGAELLIILLLILLNGVFAMSELALVSARRARLQHAARGGDAAARRALWLAEHPDLVLSTAQIGITLIGVLAGAFGGATVSQRLAEILRGVPWLAGHAHTLAVAIVVVAITYLSLVLGELVPKRLALARPEAVAKAMAGFMSGLARAAGPAVWLLSASTNLLLRLLPVQRTAEPPVTDEEVRHLMRVGALAGQFEPTERTIVDMALRLADRRVTAMMTPRTQMEALDVTDPPEALKRQILESRHLRFPVVEGSPDRVIGVVEVRDFLAQHFAGRDFDLAAATKPALYIPETVTALKALEILRSERSRIGFVVDEYGGFLGVVTLSDLLSALVSELPTAGPDQTPGMVRRADGSYLVDGLLPVDVLKHAFGLALPDEEERSYHTVAGLVMERLRRVPNTADSFELHGVRFEVMDMDGRRVDKVLVTPPADRETVSGG
ncbi:MAG: HlyC/CorC family transporter [Rhodospirillaceae bacterium]|nr:HlyC/CorC family transporter [Rhodospirillaceae bacterium]